MERIDFKRLTTAVLSEPAKDKDGNIIRVYENGVYRIVSRAEKIIDKWLSRAERGDMFAVKLLVDLIEPKQLRIAVAHAVTVEHTLNPVLQTIVDRLTDKPNTIEKPIPQIENAKKTTPIKNRSHARTN